MAIASDTALHTLLIACSVQLYKPVYIAIAS